jgi:hypothetical protein
MHVVSLVLLVTEVQWRLWDSLDLPQIDEAWALLDGFRLARGDARVTLVWWDSPLYTLSYALVSEVTRSVEGAFYTQRFVLSVVSVLVLYLLFRRLVPHSLAWFGAAWWAVSPALVDLNFDRTDFLAASTCTWLALSAMTPLSAQRGLVAVLLSVAASFFHPSFAAVLFGVLLYLTARIAYSHLRLERRLLLLLLGLVTVVVFVLGCVAVAALIARRPEVESYFVWVFANNRSWSPRNIPPNEHLGLWPMFDRDFDARHSLMSLFGHPGSLVKDSLYNSAELMRLTKQFTTSTTWGTISVQFGRWLLAVLVISVAIVVLLGRHWHHRWRAYATTYGDGWLSLLPLLAYVPVLVFFWPFPVYVVVIVPLVISAFLLAYLVLVKRSSSSGQTLPVLAIVAVLVLAPTPRSFYGLQPIRHIVAFFEQVSPPTTPLRLLGQSAITICPYVANAGRACEGDKWDDETGSRTLTSFTDKKDYDYLVYDRDMAYVLSQPAGLREILTGQDTHWRQVAEIGDYRIYQRMDSP